MTSPPAVWMTHIPRPTHGSSQPLHLPQLDGLRALAASMVVLHHCYSTTWPFWEGEHPPVPYNHVLSWLIFGRYAVDLFIVLSGFCLAIPVIRNGGLRGGALGFARARVRRVVPPYYVAIALSVAFKIGLDGQPPWDPSAKVFTLRVASCLLFLCNVIGVGAVNGVFWSIAVETQIYTLFPTMVAAWKRFGLLATMLGFSAVALTGSYLLMGTKLQTLTLWYIPLFLMGVAAASIALADWARLMRLPWGGITVVVMTLILGMNYVDRRAVGWQPDEVMTDLLVGFASACGLVSVVGRPGLVTRFLSSRPLVFVGTFAYSIYLIHSPLLAFLIRHAAEPMHLMPTWRFAFLVGVCYPLILLVSYGFFLAFERPFLNRRRVQVQEAQGYPSGLSPTTG